MPFKTWRNPHFIVPALVLWPKSTNTVGPRQKPRYTVTTNERGIEPRDASKDQGSSRCGGSSVKDAVLRIYDPNGMSPSAFPARRHFTSASGNRLRKSAAKHGYLHRVVDKRRKALAQCYRFIIWGLPINYSEHSLIQLYPMTGSRWI